VGHWPRRYETDDLVDWSASVTVLDHQSLVVSSGIGHSAFLEQQLADLLGAHAPVPQFDDVRPVIDAEARALEIDRLLMLPSSDLGGQLTGTLRGDDGDGDSKQRDCRSDQRSNRLSSYRYGN
jgi:hypothetical protein